MQKTFLNNKQFWLITVKLTGTTVRQGGWGGEGSWKEKREQERENGAHSRVHSVIHNSVGHLTLLTGNTWSERREMGRTSVPLLHTSVVGKAWKIWVAAAIYHIPAKCLLPVFSFTPLSFMFLLPKFRDFRSCFARCVAAVDLQCLWSLYVVLVLI